MSRGLNWMQWNPGLHNGERTLGEVKASLPATPPGGIPWVVRLFENPDSRWGSPGAISLDRHDCVHILLGRGLRAEDEAFVVGFTMGAATRCETRQTAVLRALAWIRGPLAARTARDRVVRDWQYAVFMQAARRLYRPPFRFSDLDLTAFKLGFGYGESLPVRDLQDIPFETMMDLTVSEVRRRVGISVAHLEDIYRYEVAVLQTREAARLDVDDEVDHGDTITPDGPDSGWMRDKPPARPRGFRAKLARRIDGA